VKPEPPKFKINYEVSIANIITGSGIIIALIAGFVSQDNRMREMDKYGSEAFRVYADEQRDLRELDRQATAETMKVLYQIANKVGVEIK
jgi:hypothetical protein